MAEESDSLEKPGRKLFWMVVTSLIGLPVLVAGPIIGNWLTASKPRLEYELVTSAPVPVPKGKAYSATVTINISNPGNREVEHVTAFLQVQALYVKAIRPDKLGANEYIRLPVAEGVASIEIHYINQKDSLSVQFILLSPTADIPKLEGGVHSKGVTVSPRAARG